MLVHEESARSRQKYYYINSSIIIECCNVVSACENLKIAFHKLNRYAARMPN